MADQLSDAQIRELIADFQQGTSAQALADRYECGATTIKRLLKDRGARANRKLGERLTDEDVAALVTASHSGTSQRELAERYCISQTSVKKILSLHRRQLQ
jgi:transposase